MSTSATKTVSAQKAAKPARLGYVYLYRMYQFNRMKKSLEILPDEISLEKKKLEMSRIPAGGMHFSSPVADYHGWRLQRLAAKKERLEKRLPMLAAKLNNEQKLSEFASEPSNDWPRFLQDAAIGAVLFATPIVGAVVGLGSLVQAITPGIPGGAAAAYVIGATAAVIAMVALGIFAADRFFKAAWMPGNIGEKKAQDLVSYVKKLAA